MPKTSDEFIQKVKELLKLVTGKPFRVVDERDLDGCVWGIVLDGEKLNPTEKITMNKGAYWVQEEKDGTIHVYSYRFYDVNDVVSEEYDLDLRIDNELMEKSIWEKYRHKVPGLIAELEAIERIIDEANKKYGTNIKLVAGHKPYLETSFYSRTKGEDEKLHEIEKHARVMHETWEIWHKWSENVGREIYRKTTKKRIGRDEFIEEVKSQLRNISGVTYSRGKKGRGTLWIRVGDIRDKDNMVANRGVWLIKEKGDSIIMMSDDLKTINARSIEDRVLFPTREKLAVQTTEEGFGEIIISPELIKGVIEQVEKKFKVKIRVRKDKLIMVTAFYTGKLRPYGKLYEIEKHAKALVEAWSQIKYACNA